MAFRQIKTPAIASGAVTNTKLDKTAISGQAVSNTVGSLVNDTILLYSAVDDALRRVTVSGVLNSFTTDDLNEGTTNKWFTDQRAIDAVTATINTAIATSEAGTTSDLSALTTALNNEISRAETAEGALQSAITAEETARIAGDNAITTAYTAADTNLQNQINNILQNTDEQALNSLAEIVTEFQFQDTALSAAIQANANNIAAEITNRQTADASLQTQITNLQSEVDRSELGAGLNADGTYTANVTAHYINAATSLKSADNQLDAALWTEANARSTGDTNLQSELDATQTGAGLEANGGYLANAVSTYLVTATSLKNADDLLDQALNAEVIRAQAAEGANAQGIADEIVARGNAITSVRTDFAAADTAIQGELDATQVGAGLSTTGSYVADNTTNYIQAATSLANADKLLDTALKTAYDDLQGQINAATSGGSTTQVELDTTQAGAGLNTDGTLVGWGPSFATITSATSLADAIGKLDVGLYDEANARTTADTALATRIDNVNTGTGLSGDAYTADGAANFTSTATSLFNADQLLDAALKVEKDRIDYIVANTDPAVLDSLSEIVTSFQQADSNLQSLINSNTTAIATETTNRTTQDGILQGNIDAEASARSTADTTLQTNIDTEATNRATQDGILQGNIDTEASARASADSALQGELDATQSGAGLQTDGTYSADATTNYLTLATSLKDADKKLDAAIAGEAGVRATNDGLIQSELDATQVGAGLTATGVYTTRTTSNYLNTSTSLYHADTLLDQALKNNVNALQLQIDTLDGGSIDIQDELDITQGGAGLNADGSYTPNGSANYISAAASLKDADNKLDTALKTEETDRIFNDNALLTSINTEAQSRIDGDNALNTAIGNETTARINADSALDTRVTTNEGDIATLQGSLTTEISAREGQDTILSGRITINEGDIATLENRVDAILAGTTESLDTFIEVVNAFQTADSDINNAITQLATDSATARSTLETNLQSQITTNNTARINGDANLQNELDATQTGAGLLGTGSYSAYGVYDVVGNPTGARYIGNATSLHNADKLLDEQLYSATTDLQGQINAITGDSSVLDELTATQAGAGLATDGTYIARSASNYINASTSLYHADTLLDAALKAEETARVNAVNAINTELTDTQIGAGLAANGGYTAHTGTNYIDAATSLHSADSLLDGAIKAEKDRALTAEGVLTTNLATEVTNRTNADTTLQTNIDNEVTRATGVEGDLQTQITSNLNEITTSQAGAGLNTDGTYTAPTTSNFHNAATSLKNADSLLDTAIKAEETRALAAEGVLQGNIDAEATARTNADSALTTAINTEVTDRTNADANLQTQIDNLVASTGGDYSSLVATDASLQSQIDSILSNTDQAALDSLTEIVAAFQTADSTITGLVSANQAAVTAAQGEIDVVETAVGLAADGTYIAHTGQNYINGATSVFAADELLDSAIKGVDTAVRADFATADTNLQTALQANIDTKVSKAGDSMTGALAMGTNNITGLATGTANDHAVNKGQMDSALAAQHISVFNTDDLAEGAINKYFTAVRATDAVNASAYTFPTTAGTTGQGLRFDGTGNLVVDDVASNLFELTDVLETAFTGKQNFVLAVNETETGMTFRDPSELVYVTNNRQVLNGDGVQTVFALDFYSTQTDALVFVGGVIQDPGTHYTISSVDQEITFTSALPLGTQAVVIMNPIGNVPYVEANSIGHEQLADNVKAYEQQPDVVSGTAGAVVDSFSTALYRTAKYVIQVSNGAGAFESREALVVHDGVNAYITEYALVYTGAGLLGDASVQINAGQVELVYTANGEGYTVTVISTYIDA